MKIILFFCVQERDIGEQANAVQSIATNNKIDPKTIFLASPNDFPTKLRAIVAKSLDVMKLEHL